MIGNLNSRLRKDNIDSFKQSNRHYENNLRS